MVKEDVSNFHGGKYRHKSYASSSRKVAVEVVNCFQCITPSGG